MPADTPPAPKARQRFRRRLLAWYRAHGRDLPWRNTDDPYHILVSEVMLQQTQVDRVLPKYHEWLGKYPSFEALALAPIDDVTQTWRPLGYNIRPRRLHAIACESVSRYGGRLPSDEATLLSFKGIGQYTAGAIRSFAFRQRAAILDTNVARVLFRVFVAQGDPKAHAMKRQLWALSEALVPHKHVFDFNQALMDFGATQCPARAPQCGICPMRRFCQSYRTLSKPAAKKAAASTTGPTAPTKTKAAEPARHRGKAKAAVPAKGRITKTAAPAKGRGRARSNAKAALR